MNGKQSRAMRKLALTVTIGQPLRAYSDNGGNDEL